MLVGGVVLFLFGVVVKRFVFHAESIDLVPLIDFWRSAPALVRDGVRFVLGGCGSQSAAQYERM